MMKLSSVKKVCLCAICIALCYVLPIAFHTLGLGSVLSPMHIPVLLCGLICGWPYGLVCGILGPCLSSLLTSMPPAVILPSMVVECAVYGCVTGLMMRYVRTGRSIPDLYISMVTAMVAGRVLSGFAKAWIFSMADAPFAWVTTSLVAGIPGIVIQLVLIPLLVVTMTKAHLLPERYSKTCFCVQSVQC